MLNLINEIVTHKSFGKGTITAMDNTTITVKFASKTCKFLYPNAFDKYLVLCNLSLANEIIKELNKHKEAEEVKKKTETERVQARLAESQKNLSNIGSYRKIDKNLKLEVSAYEPLYDVPVVNSFNDIMYNCDVIDSYLKSKKDPEYSYALSLIKRGTCFLAIEIDGKYKFYPSRFIGYFKNSMEQHERNTEKDGRVTNPAISFSINQGQPVPNAKLDALYRNYCNMLGINASDKGSFGVERKYWLIHLALKH